MLLINLLFSLIICFILGLVLVLLIGNFYVVRLSKIMTFECGFLPFTTGRFPVSLRFFLVVLLFLVFDIEILMLIPYVCFVRGFQRQVSCFVFLFIFFVLLLGLYYEWNQGRLN